MKLCLVIGISERRAIQPDYTLIADPITELGSAGTERTTQPGGTEGEGPGEALGQVFSGRRPACLITPGELFDQHVHLEPGPRPVLERRVEGADPVAPGALGLVKRSVRRREQ